MTGTDTPENYMSVIRLGRTGGSDRGAVQPGDGGGADRVPERLEFVVPPPPAGEAQLAVQLDDARAGGVHGGADAVLRDDDVAGGVGLRVEDAEVGRVQPAAAVDAVARVLRHLEAQVFPSAQGGSNGGAGARRAFPVEVGALRTAEH